MAHTLMIQGTCSDAGKSILVAAFCRIYSRRGYRVAPFKSQNMALNSFVTPRGNEIGRAQVVQARAAGHYYMAKKDLWPKVTGAMDRLCAENDIVIAEGAGSPAEINLKAHEIVNMAVARYLKAPVLLAGDIDRGGVFASLYGTLELVDEDREMIRGFLINKFRGDPALLMPGIDMLTERCGGVPTLGIIPYIPDIYLAQEDSVFIERKRQWGDEDGLDIAVIKFPRLSNYDDMDPFLREKGVKIRFVSSTAELGHPAAIILPGSKTTLSDLGWLRETGLFDRIQALAKQGIAVAGICGGYQIMGETIRDPHGLEGTGGDVSGLGLLPVETNFSDKKITIQSRGTLDAERGFIRKLNGSTIKGYEIHMGESLLRGNAAPLYHREDGSKDGALSANGKCWGSYMHGIFDNLSFRRAFLKSLGWKVEEEGECEELLREREFERIADAVENAVDMNALDRLIGLKQE
ncbi:MAG: cobyric acid synthase CobQ [Spirochaetaceae bacterium 4572_59]|nr:MAG: cobyric acid synthase CobQ [Spirochaetaceae bacterium 4572_59]